MQAELGSRGRMNEETRPRTLQRLLGQEEEEEMHPQTASPHFQRRALGPQQLNLENPQDCHRQCQQL